MESEYKPQKWKPPERISTVVTDWLIYCSAYNRPSNYRTVIQRLAKSLPENVKTIEQIEKTHVENYVTDILRKAETSTVCPVCLPGIRAFFRWLSEKYGTPLIVVESRSRLRQHRLKLRKGTKPERPQRQKKLRILRVEGKPDSNVIEEWNNYCRSHNKPVQYCSAISQFPWSLPDSVQTVQEIKKEHIENYVVSLLRECTNSTLNVYLPAVRGFLKWLSKEYGTPLIVIKSRSSLRQHRLSLPKPPKPPKPVKPRRIPPPPKPLPVIRARQNPDSNVLEEWLLYIQGLAEHTRYYYKRLVLDFVATLPDKPIEELETSQIRNYINRLLLKGQKNSTVNNSVTVLRVFGRFLAETYGIANPAANLKKFKVGAYHQPFISRQQYEKILAVATQRQSDIIQLLAHTGLRVSELASLKYENITENFSAIRFVGKGSKMRTVPLNNTAREILARHCKNETLINFPKNRKTIYRYCQRAGKLVNFPKTKQGIGYICRTTGRQAGIPLAPHMLRRFFASQLVDRGVSLLIVSKLLGHASIQTTERYLKVDSSFLNGATDILDQGPKRQRGGQNYG
jgi:integrase/recombinase XerD